MVKVMHADKKQAERFRLRDVVLPKKKARNSYEASLDAVSKRARVGFVSQRVHGTITPSFGTIVNTRPPIGRNKRVSVAGDPVVKLKHSSIARKPIPHQYIKDK